MPLLSVILSAYNSERFIASAVESILAQTFADFELIVINDGSTDATESILRDLEKRDARIRIISRPNTGQVRAAIEGIAASTGELIARMDADDLASPERFAQQIAIFNTRPEVVLVGGSYELVDELGRLLTTIHQPTDDATLQRLCLEGTTPICQPAAMFRRSAYEKTAGYDPQYSPAEDLDLWLKLGEVGAMSSVPEVVLKYRQHAKSLSESKQGTQIENQRAACEAAWARRNVIGQYRFRAGEGWRAKGDRTSRYEQSTRFGWWAWNSGSKSTARAYGWQAVKTQPFKIEGWKLLVASAIKTAPTPR